MPDRYIVIHRVPERAKGPTPGELVDTGRRNLVVGYFPDRTLARRVAELLNADDKEPLTAAGSVPRPVTVHIGTDTPEIVVGRDQRR